MSVNTITVRRNRDRRHILDMPLMHAQSTGIARRGWVLLLILLSLGRTALCQSSTSAANALQHRMNITACGYGLLDCNESQLTPSEFAEANAIRRRVNVAACGYGLLGCNESQLTPPEVAEVNAIRHRVNVTACGYGFPGCNESRLTPSEIAEVNASRKRISALMAAYGLPEPESVPDATVGRAGVGSTFTWSPAVAENGSYYGEPNTNGVPKTVHVDGYFRSNGTYVRGYYRSAPGTNPR
jgi:hypothetical protein